MHAAKGSMKGCFRRLLTSEAADPSRLHRPLPPPQYSLALALYRGGGAVTPYNVHSLSKSLQSWSRSEEFEPDHCFLISNQRYRPLPH